MLSKLKEIICSLNNKKNNKVIFVIKFMVTALLIKFLVEKLEVSFLKNKLEYITILDGLKITFLFVVLLTLSVLRWWLVSRNCKLNLHPKKYISIFLIGLFFNQALPSTIGGDVVRIWYVTKAGNSFYKSISSVLGERLLGLVSLLVLIMITLPIGFFYFNQQMIKDMTIFLIGMLSPILLLLYFNKYVINSSFWPRDWLIKNKIEQISIFFKLSRNNIAAFMVSCILHIFTIYIFYSIALLLHIDLDYFSCLYLTLPVFLIMMLPVSLGGWGVREGALAVAYSTIGINIQDTLAISMLFGILCIFISLPGGILFAIAKFKNIFDGKYLLGKIVSYRKGMRAIWKTKKIST